METVLHLAGYVDWGWMKFDELKSLPCFAPGTTYIIELTEVDEDLFEGYKDADDLKDRIFSNDISITVAENLSVLADFEPKKIIPLMSPSSIFLPGKTFEEAVFIKSVEIHGLLKGILKDLSGNITYLGGNSHANYLANHLEFPHKVLYDFNIFQARYSSLIRGKLIDYFAKMYGDSIKIDGRFNDFTKKGLEDYFLNGSNKI